MDQATQLERDVATVLEQVVGARCAAIAPRPALGVESASTTEGPSAR